MISFSKIHARVGDFWWWSAVLFIALRCGDVINAFVGLWLVPRYVSQAELGAVLPLLQITSVFGLPISILVLTFTKFLNEYQTKGERGKVKALIRAFWCWSVVAILSGTAISMWMMPHFFERIRVTRGSLGVLIVVTAVLSTSAPVFINALQALKKFGAMSVMNLCTAPIRLVVMWLTMPIRALSGYMLGQAAPYAFQIGYSIISLRHELTSDVKSVTFWRDDWRRIVKFIFCVSLSLGYGTIVPVVQAMIIRQRLIEVESAAYYIISRFAELTTYASLTLVVISFPIIAEANVKGKSGIGVFLKSSLGSLAFGLLFTALLAVVGTPLLSAMRDWSAYVQYVPDMVILATALTIATFSANFVTSETAKGSFRFLWYSVPIAALHAIFIVCFTGCEYFRGILPDGWVNWMAACHIDTLRNILWTLFSVNLITAIANVVDLIVSNRKK